MMRGELKVITFFFLLAFFSGLVNAGKWELFKITSNTTMLRRWKNNSSKDICEQKILTSCLDDIFYSYLQSSNDNEIIQSSQLPKKIEIFDLRDVYVNTCDTHIILQNVNYKDFDVFQRSPVEVETKVRGISNHRTTQIVSSIKTNIMTLSGEMVLPDSNHTFTANLTHPTYRIEKDVSHQISFNSVPSSESFTFEGFFINIQPKDMYSVLLKKHELRTSILQRLADTWFPVIANSLNHLLLPKIQQHEKLLSEGYKKLFFRNICNLLIQQNETKISMPDSSDSITLRGLSSFNHCEGDAMVVKKTNSYEMYDSSHTIWVFVNYNSSLLITKEQANVYSSTSSPLYRDSIDTDLLRRINPYSFSWSTNRRYKMNDYSTPTYRYIKKPTTARPCTEMNVKNIQAMIAFDVEKGKIKIKRVIKTDFNFSMDQSSLRGCAYSSLIDDIKSYFSKKLEEYFAHVGQ